MRSSWRVSVIFIKISFFSGKIFRSVIIVLWVFSFCVLFLRVFSKLYLYVPTIKVRQIIFLTFTNSQSYVISIFYRNIISLHNIIIYPILNEKKNTFSTALQLASMKQAEKFLKVVSCRSMCTYHPDITTRRKIF